MAAAAFFARRVRELRRDFTWREASGSMGDLGTFVPFLVGLSTRAGLDVGTTLFFTGAYNLATAIAFDVPMPVQPMKAIAAVALADDAVRVPEMVAAGAFVALVLLALAATGLVDRFNDLTPRAVVHGVQIGVGVTLAARAVDLGLRTERGEIRPALGADGTALGVLALAIVAYGATVARDDASDARDDDDDDDDDALDALGGGEPSGAVAPSLGSAPTSRPHADANVNDRRARRPSSFAAAPALLVLGLVVASTREGALAALRLGPSPRFGRVVAPSLRSVSRGVFKAGIPQLPLTTLNSVLATCALSETLFPEDASSSSSSSSSSSTRRSAFDDTARDGGGDVINDSRFGGGGKRKVRVATLASSIGAMNLVGAPFGAMPACHGAGGLAAHYHFGARTGAAVAFLGAVKIAASLAFGSSLAALLAGFPETVLAVMLLSAAAELARAGARGVEREVRETEGTRQEGRVGRGGGGLGGDGGDGGGTSRTGSDEPAVARTMKRWFGAKALAAATRRPVLTAAVTAAGAAASGNAGAGALIGFGAEAIAREASRRMAWDPDPDDGYAPPRYGELVGDEEG
jgi:hypothetical protein